MNIIRLAFLSLIGLLLIASCKKDATTTPEYQAPVNNAPAIPGKASPESGLDGLSIETDLNWSCSDPDSEMIWFQVYFGLDSIPRAVTNRMINFAYDPQQLAYRTTYFWQIRAFDAAGDSSLSPVWSFTTGDSGDAQPPNIPVNQFPPDGSHHRWLDEVLGWVSDDVDTDTLYYDVFCGTSSPPPLKASDLTDREFHLSGLTEQTTYYWRITVRDESGSVATGPIWSFTTGKNDTIAGDGESRIFPLGNSPLYIEMVHVPAGWFDMGSPLSDHDSNNDERPVHRVNFENGFWVGRYELTVMQISAVYGLGIIDDRPAGGYSWTRTQNLMEALGGRYRLPSEAEWEYACRGGSTGRTYWPDDANYNSAGQNAWYLGNSGGEVHKAGQKMPNPLGLYDMAGNLWEWCEDWYFAGYDGAPADGSARTEPARQNRVLRGGAYTSAAPNLRSASRFEDYPAHARDDAGVRLVRGW